jgi:hypothetical protein
VCQTVDRLSQIKSIISVVKLYNNKHRTGTRHSVLTWLQAEKYVVRSPQGVSNHILSHFPPLPPINFDKRIH